MPRLSVNLRDAVSREAVPDDTYECIVFDITGPHKGPKAAYVKVIFQISEGEYEGRKLYDNRPIEGEGAGMFADFYSKVTGEDIDVDDLEELDVDTEDLLGEPVGVVTKQEEWPENSGEYQSRVSRLVRP